MSLPPGIKLPINDAGDVPVNALVRIVASQCRVAIPAHLGVALVVFGPEPTEGDPPVLYFSYGNNRDAKAALLQTAKLIGERAGEPRIIVPGMN